MIGVGLGFGLLLSILGLTAWQVAGQKVDGTEGLVAQGNLLVAVFQAGVGLAVALATIYYAGLTREMAEGVQASAQKEQDRAVEVMANELIGATLEVALHSGAVATLLKPSWRWYLPAPGRMRDRLLVQAQAQVTASLSAVTRSADVLRATVPDQLSLIDDLLERTEAVFLGSLEGDLPGVERDARQLRISIDRLRAEMVPHGSGAVGSPTA